MVGIERLATRATLLENDLSIHVFGRYSRCQKQGHEDGLRDAFQQEAGVLGWDVVFLSMAHSGVTFRYEDAESPEFIPLEWGTEYTLDTDSP